MKIINLVLLVPIALLLLAPVHATTPILITGNTNVVTSTTVDTRTAGGNTIITATQQIAFAGGMQGSGVHTFTLKIESTGQFTNRGTGLFTGTVNGSQSGTADYSFEVTGSIISQTQQGQIVIGDGSGGLAGLHGQGTAASSGSLSVATFSLEIHFDQA
jgi:hypothetical protein